MPAPATPKPGDQRQQFDAEILQRHDREQAHHQHPRHAGQKLQYGRFEFQAMQGAIRAARGPARDHETDRQDQYRHQQLRPEADGKIDQSVLGVRQRIELSVHQFSFCDARLRLARLRLPDAAVC